VVAFLLLGACRRQWVREYDGVLPRTWPGRVAVFLVRDLRTGRPIEGALVRQHLEWAMGRDGRWAPSVAEARTDEYGLVAFPLDEETGDFHWVIRAKGYAPTERYGADVEEEVDLVPGTRRAGRLLDIDGQPLAGAELEWKLGCAHSPAVASARTDEHGRFVFDGVDKHGDAVFVGGQGVAAYVDTAPVTMPWRIPTYQIFPGRTIEGRVVRGDGMPPLWAVVTTLVRGPCATTAADGTFALPGVGGPGLGIWWNGGLVEALEDYAPGMPVLLHLEGEAEPAPVPVRVRVRDEEGATPEESVTVHFDRVSDGRRFSVEWSSWGEGVVGIELAPGDYLVRAGGHSSSHVSEPQPLAIRESSDVEIVVGRQPTLSIRPPNIAASYDARWWVVLEDASWTIDPAGDEPLHLPADGRAWVRVDLDGVPHTYEIGPHREGARSVAVRLPGIKFIPVPGGDEGVEAELLSAEARPVGSGLATFAAGEQWLRLTHPQRGWALVPLTLPWEAAEVQLRDVAWQPWPDVVELRVLDPDGRPAGGIAVTGLDLPTDPAWPWPGEERTETDEEGIFRARWLRDGTYVRIVAPDAVPLRTQLAGRPPYEIRLGSATVEVDLSEFTDGACLLDGWPVAADHEGRVTLRGVTAGEHVLVAGANGRRCLAHLLVLREGETRRLKPRLPRR